jgi:hypothetical protein
LAVPWRAFKPHYAYGLFGHLKGLGIRHPRTTHICGGEACGVESLFNLLPCAVNDHQPHAKAVEERDVVNDPGELLRSNDLAVELDDEDPVPVGVDVWRRVAKPGDVVLFGAHVSRAV